MYDLFFKNQAFKAFDNWNSKFLVVKMYEFLEKLSFFQPLDNLKASNFEFFSFEIQGGLRILASHFVVFDLGNLKKRFARVKNNNLSSLLPLFPEEKLKIQVKKTL